MQNYYSEFSKWCILQFLKKKFANKFLILALEGKFLRHNSSSVLTHEGSPKPLGLPSGHGLSHIRQLNGSVAIFCIHKKFCNATLVATNRNLSQIFWQSIFV